MNQPRVHLIMATYNGEKYVRDQIESILNQKYDNLKLYIYDDGSSDRTVDIINQYIGEKVELIKGDHVGYPSSFFEALSFADGADYYGFSDQDDVWFPEKVSRAVEKLSRLNINDKNLYFSRFNYCDKDMNFIRESDIAPKEILFRNAFFQCYLWGFTVVINEAFRKELLQGLPLRTKMKDYWIHLLCGAFGNFVYDDSPCANHRRHGKNHSEDPNSFVRFQLWRIKHFLFENVFADSHDLLVEFYEKYKDKLTPEKRKELELFCSKNSKLKKIFYPHRLRSSLFDEILLRLSFILGKL